MASSSLLFLSEPQMDFTSIRIKNFKAINDATLSDLAKFNVIVGTNGSVKSSALQALHWVLQSGRNLAVDTNRDKDKGATLSASDANYMPSPDYKNAGYKILYGNRKTAPKLEIELISPPDEDGEAMNAHLWIRAARNEGITVHVPSSNKITAQIRNQGREISAYIPGLAGHSRGWPSCRLPAARRLF